MSNPAINLLKPQQKKKAESSRISVLQKGARSAAYVQQAQGKYADKNLTKVKIYLGILGLILVIFILIIAFWGSNFNPYRAANPSRGLLSLLPSQPDYLVYFKPQAVKDKKYANLFKFYNDLAAQRNLGDWEESIGKVLAQFSLTPSILQEGSREAAWAKFSKENQTGSVIILSLTDPAKATDFLLKQGFTEDNLSSEKMKVYGHDKTSAAPVFALLDHNLLALTQDQSLLCNIIKLANNPRESLYYDARLRQVWHKVDNTSPFFVYSTKTNWPAALSIESSGENVLALKAYYLGQVALPAKDPSWFRFIPQEAVGVFRGSPNGFTSLAAAAAGQNFWNKIFHYLSFGKFEQDLADFYNLDWRADIASLMQNDFEVIALPANQSNPHPLVLIVPWNQDSEAKLAKIQEALGVIAAYQNYPEEKSVVLPDGTAITEYIRNDVSSYLQEKEIEGIPVSVIDALPQNQKFIAGRLGNKLVVSNTEEAFAQLVLSFRESEEGMARVITAQWRGEEEWLYFNLGWWNREVLGAVLPLPDLSAEALAKEGELEGAGDILPVLQKVQGTSKQDQTGTLVRLWLGF